MTRPWLQPIPESAHIAAATTAAIPMIVTERLQLRAPRLSDWEILEPIWTTERARFVGGPFSPEDAWLDFCQAIVGWLLRGTAGWTVTDSQTDAVLGLVGLFFDYGDSELELGWLITAEAEGRGVATEAARAVRDYAFDTLQMPSLVSLIAVGNDASVRVAEKLGSRMDPNEIFTDGDGDQAMIYRYKPDDRGGNEAPEAARRNSDKSKGGTR